MTGINQSIVQISGDFAAQGLSIAIVAARWNEQFTERLLCGACEELRGNGLAQEAVTVVRVPGSFEVPVLVKELAQSGKYNAIITLGCLIRGETDHYQLIANNVVAGVSRIALETGVPITLGIICAESMEQALARSGAKAGNYGAQAARAAVETANVLKQVREANACVENKRVALRG